MERDNLGRFKKGIVSWNKNKKGIKYTNRKSPKSFSAEHRRKLSESHKGSRNHFFGKKILDKTTHPNWIKDRSKLKKSENKMNDVQYKYWMKEVKNRDSWKCKLSSSDCKGRLESHHIFNWIFYPTLRYVLTNGITLCAFHHPRGREEEKRMIPILQELLSVSKEKI